MNYHTIKVRFEGAICFLQFNRPKANNTINDCLIKECHQVLNLCEESINIIVLEGLPEVFCYGADFKEVHDNIVTGRIGEQNSESLYNLWLRIAYGPFVTISHVRGKVNAGGIGFVAASDIILADESSQFSLSELLFGLLPACVLPYLTRRVGFQKAHYMTLMTKPVSVKQAYTWGLVDGYDTNSDNLVRMHLLRLKVLSKKAIRNYKNYLSSLDDSIFKAKSTALRFNKEVFSDSSNIKSILRFIEKGQLPWES